MKTQMANWGRDGFGIWLEGSVGLGQARTFLLPESRRERLPIRDSTGGFVFTAAGRVDNRAELGRELELPADEQSMLADSEFILLAYRRWGETSWKRIQGDWAAAAWHPAERRLFLARDPLGDTSIHYHASPEVFAFASSPFALTALDLVPRELDELYLAQLLVCWPGHSNQSTIHRSISRLPPAHTLTVDAARLTTRCYWSIEETPPLRLANRLDYVEPFRALFDQAVRARLRACGPVAVTLSGGLDSGSVASTAAALLRAEGKRLLAFTSTPLHDTAGFLPGGRPVALLPSWDGLLADERHLARATAELAGNVDVELVSATALNPIQAIRQMLRIYGEPAMSASNLYWIAEMEANAHRLGCKALLTGQRGNAGPSWAGVLASQTLRTRWRLLGTRSFARSLYGSLRRKLRSVVPHAWLTEFRRRRNLPREWYRASAIHPDFAHRLRLWEQFDDSEIASSGTGARELRYGALKPALSFGGALHAQMGAAHGLEVRDPTGDARLIAFLLSVPDEIFIDPDTGFDRWLIREAMKGRLPDEVRLNRKLGIQAADLVPRLRACAGDVEQALDEVASGPAAAYVDATHMREIWRRAQRESTPELFDKSIMVLARGIMAGLWLNEFFVDP